MENVKTVETANYIYSIYYKPSRIQKGGVWMVKKISTSNPYVYQIATIKNNPNETIDSVIDNYENLTYNYIQDLE